MDNNYCQMPHSEAMIFCQFPSWLVPPLFYDVGKYIGMHIVRYNIKKQSAKNIQYL